MGGIFKTRLDAEYHHYHRSEGRGLDFKNIFIDILVFPELDDLFCLSVMSQ